MKSFIKILFVTGMSAACAYCNKSIKKFIPGTYVTYYENEFHKVFDTLVIKETCTNGIYEMEDREFYTTTIDGKILTPKVDREEMQGVFDEKTKTLVDQKHGVLIIFDPKNNTLKRATREYQKIN